MQQKWKTSGILYDAGEISRVLFNDSRTEYKQDPFMIEESEPFLCERDEERTSFAGRKPTRKSGEKRDYARFGKIDPIERGQG